MKRGGKSCQVLKLANMYDIEALKNLLLSKDYCTITDDGSVRKPSDPVYLDISNAMIALGSSMSAKHVYQTVKANRNHFLEIIMEKFTPHLVQQSQIIIQDQNDCNESDGSKGSISDFHPSSSSDNFKEFQIVVSAKNWNLVKPNKKVVGQKMTLRKNKWTDVMADLIYGQTKITCAFSFKKSVIAESSSAKYYVEVQGKCKECGARLKGNVFKKPQENADVIFHFLLTGYRYQFSHSKRRNLRGERRECVANQLISQRKPASV